MPSRGLPHVTVGQHSHYAVYQRFLSYTSTVRIQRREIVLFALKNLTLGMFDVVRSQFGIAFISGQP
jgi:hypothetical protein